MAWTKRTTIPLTCPSGNKITVRRPGPDLALKATRLPRILQSQQSRTPMETLTLIESLPNEELEKVMLFARVMIADVVVDPVLSLTPKEGQLSPDDVPLTDFWWLFGEAMAGFPSAPVELQEGETSVEAVRNFPEQQDKGIDTGEDGPAM